jgi:type I restriction enzyme M protein
MANDFKQLETDLWDAADTLRANSDLTSQQYSTPVLGLIFLKYADNRFTKAKAEMGDTSNSRVSIGPEDYLAKGIMYVPNKARYANLVNLPEGEDIGAKINDAMDRLEDAHPDLKGVLPKTYNTMESSLLSDLLRNFNQIPPDLDVDFFGRIYEYFLGKFAMSEGQGGGEFYTPESLVKLLAHVIEPYHGKIYDPACGSGGMFVQSAKFLEDHQGKAADDISIYGQEKTTATLKLAKMNMAVHGLSADIRSGNTYYEDPFNCNDKFDFVLANPPFNVNGVKKENIKDDPRYPFGIPKPDNANYLWIQNFYTALNDNGRAGFVMANSASDARQSEQEIRKQMIDSGHVDVMVSISSNFFYTVTLPVTLWFFDKGKPADRKDKVLFIDAREIFTQVDRAHRAFEPSQLEFLANIVRLYRGNDSESVLGSNDLMEKHFPDGKYDDVKGLCKVTTLSNIEEQGYSLNPGRYVGVADEEDDGVDFHEKLTELNEELEGLKREAKELEDHISKNISELLK